MIKYRKKVVVIFSISDEGKKEYSRRANYAFPVSSITVKLTSCVTKVEDTREFKRRRAEFKHACKKQRNFSNFYKLGEFHTNSSYLI